MNRQTVLCIGLIIASPVLVSAQRPVVARDLLRLREVSDPQLSPDGGWVAYTVTTADTVRDRRDRDVWMTSWDGSRSVRVTSSPDQEHAARWSPDGRYLAFLSARQDPREADQLWLLDRAGGEAERVTDLPGGISEYAWAPDGHRIALVASDPPQDSLPAAGDSAGRRPKPIVVDRFVFKYDGEGFLGAERDHLYLFDLATRRAELLTPGPYDESMPSWSPDGRRIAFVSRRRPEFDRSDNWDLYVVDARAGAEPRQLTTFKGADLDPEWGSRAPSWSPDGKLLAYVQGGRPELIYYAVQKLAVVPADGGPARVLTEGLDRNVLSPAFSADGRSILFLQEDDRVYHLARIPVTGGKVEPLVGGPRMVSDLTLGRDGRVAVLAGTTAQPDEIYAVDNAELRKISRQNDAWLGSVRLAPVEEISVRSKDGTEIHGFMVKPPDYQEGRRYPTVLRIHGGPVWQFYHDFANLDWQVLAAAGYVVLGMNPRGSSGRGEKFATAIWAAWGQKDGEDVLSAVDWAVRQGIADPGRLGVGGWSYGGILTDEVIARDPRFKAAISGAGQGNALGGYGTDMYAIEYEAELGTPWKNPEAWTRVSYPFLHADRIVTPTLFLCGDEDWNVPLNNSEQMYQALKSLGRDTQLIVYPGQTHEITRPSFVEDRMDRYVAWYGKYLGTAGAPSAPTTAGGGANGRR